MPLFTMILPLPVAEAVPYLDLVDYVLGHFSREEWELMEKGYERAAAAIELIVSGDIEAAMNKYNRKKKEE